MIYIYDGTFNGLLTLIFDGYKDLENSKIVTEKNQIDFLQDFRKITTDRKKANRVKTGIIGHFSEKFFRDMTVVFRSDYEFKGEVIAKTIKGMYKEGYTYLMSPNESSVMFNKLVKYVYGENHSFKGLARFREVEDGFLYAKIRPKCDILDLLTPHFVKRLPNEKFIIHDVGRDIFSIYENGYVDYFENEEIIVKDTKEEEFFKKAWIKFYDSVAIDERNNKKLMINNMPKYLWEFLPERNKLKKWL